MRALYVAVIKGYFMDLEKLRLFYDLVAAGGVRKLAEINGQSIAKISRYLAALEEDVGYTLIDRKQGNSVITLTNQGRILIETLPTVFGIFENLKQIMATKPELNAGEITIYTTNTLIEDWLIYMIHDFHDQFPNIKIDLMAHNHLFAENLKRRIISISPRDIFPDSDVCQFPLLDFHVGLWASKSYLERYGYPQTLKDLEKHKLMVYAKDINQMTYPTLHWYMKELDIKIENLMCINSSHGLIKAAHEGLGIITLSKENIRVSGFELERVLPDIDGPVVPMCFSYPKYWKGNPIIEIVQTYLADAFKKRSLATRDQ